MAELHKKGLQLLQNLQNLVHVDVGLVLLRRGGRRLGLGLVFILRIFEALWA